jgi:ATP-dependent helicase HrpB
MTDGVVRAWRADRYDELTLGEQAAPVDPEIAAEMVASAYIARGPSEDDERWLNRRRFAGLAEDQPLETLVREAARGVTRLADVRLRAQLPPELSRRLERDAPEFLSLPAGRRTPLHYRSDGRVVASVKLQHVFGLRETPRIGPRHTPVTFELLAPNGRPAQVTSDLASFWRTGYPVVRRELRARYPKHAWPERV